MTYILTGLMKALKYIWIHNGCTWNTEVTHAITHWLDTVFHTDKGFQFSIIISCTLATNKDKQ